MTGRTDAILARLRLALEKRRAWIDAEEDMTSLGLIVRLAPNGRISQVLFRPDCVEQVDRRGKSGVA